MNIPRMIAIGCIFLLASAGWWVLGRATQQRSAESSQTLGALVEALYGAPLVQQAPSFSVQIPGTEQRRWLMPESHDIKVALAADHRKKGLIWHPTYTCSFDSSYTIANTEDAVQKILLHFDFPAKGGTYDNFSIAVDETPLTAPVDTKAGFGEIIELAKGESRTFRIRYDTRGLSEWRYQMDPHAGRVRNFNLTVQTSFRNFDYPEGAWSATSVVKEDGGMALTWKTKDLITGQDIGILIPEKLNPGPLASRITFFAPVCLLFFFILVLTINILYRVSIHPMHYLFVAAGFFAFHLLMNYLAGIVNIHIAFILSAIVSVALVTCYLAAALKSKFPWKIAVAGQLFFMVLFSYSFFLKGITGLTVSIGSIVTLAILMWVTAKVDWNEVFSQWNGKNLSPFAKPDAQPAREVAEP